VYTSSVATIGFTGNGHPADEDSPVSLADMIGHYKRSKFMAEQSRWKRAGRPAESSPSIPPLPSASRTSNPLPRDESSSTSSKGKFPAYVETGLNLVDVHECARGHIAALEKGKSGERYILGGENLTLKQILDTLGAISGLPSPT
jgi:dihydroflavonol-4-reductase